MLNEMFAIAFSLFLLMDAFGNIPIYLTVLAEIPQRRRVFIIIRELVIALILIIIFAFFGNAFFSFLGIKPVTMHIAGGIVLFVMAIKMLFPEKGSLHDSFGAIADPLIFPLAVPLISGPSVLAAVMIYSRQLNSTALLVEAILLAWFVSVVILASSTYLVKWLGERGIKALERLMGLVLMLIAINMFLDGWKEICTWQNSPSAMREQGSVVGNEPTWELV